MFRKDGLLRQTRTCVARGHVNTELTTRVEGRRNGYAHDITHELGKSLELDPIWDTVELDSMLFAQKRFFRNRRLGASQTSPGTYGTNWGT